MPRTSQEYLKKGTNTQLKLLRERVDLEFGDNPEHFFPEDAVELRVRQQLQGAIVAAAHKR